MSLPASAAKFDPSRAHEYAEQSRIALAGYDACRLLPRGGTIIPLRGMRIPRNGMIVPPRGKRRHAS